MALGIEIKWAKYRQQESARIMPVESLKYLEKASLTLTSVIHKFTESLRIHLPDLLKVEITGY